MAERPESASKVSVQGDGVSIGSDEKVQVGLDGHAKLAQEHIFQDEALYEYWKGVYEKAKYEGRHRLDPDVQWTQREEAKLVRRLDLRIMLWVWVMFMALDLMRYNINRALADGRILKDLGMTQNDINNGQLIFFLCFLFMELPSGLISKKLGPERWVPIQVVAWSTVGVCQAALQNRAGYFATRALLGVCQGGFIPDMCLYLTYFYTSKEMNTRLGFFYTVLGLSEVVGCLLGAGFLSIHGLNNVAGWRYLFAFDGLISGVIGLLSFAMMPSSLTQTYNWLFRGSMFTPREEAIMVNRLLRDDPSKGDMNNREAVDLKGIWQCLKDYDAWPVYILGLVILIPYQPPLTYMSYILNSMLGFSTFHSNLLAIPSYVVFAINSVWMALLSAKFHEKSIMASITNIWVFPCLVALVALPRSNTGSYAWIRYALISLINAIPYPLAFMVGWVSENASSVRTRTVALCLLNIMTQIGAIVATHVYTDDDQPYYRKGNTALAVISGLSILLCWATKVYYISRNRWKDRRWKQLTPEQQTDYSVHSAEFGPRRLDTRFVH